MIIFRIWTLIFGCDSTCHLEDNWIGRPSRNGDRRPPRFPINLWNCHQTTKENGSKTNNNCEGWHRSFNELIGACNPTIWKFIETLKMEQGKNALLVEQYLGGTEPPTKKKIYKNSSLRLQRICNNYGDYETTDYLKGIAYNLSY
eukprot:TRINITY_DN48_c0_g1_i20.p1 TRINITY_DN48_c0_g1~~TRINITY_DN48_c0_g1_i20.p1  ORF type:complete len:145 (+),score=2.51 TRINITY_DN48_c0_g1_i20:652-1086(+)